jgi:hypothetical protein
VNGCQAAKPTKGRLTIGHGKLSWKWTSSGVVMPGDFGSPTTTTNYVLCLYDQTGRKLSGLAPADGTCGTKPCWKTTRTGFKYVDKDGTPDGITRELLKSGTAAGKGKIRVKDIVVPTLPLTTPVRVQLRQDSSNTCWEATYSTASSSDSTRFKAKSD